MTRRKPSCRAWLPCGQGMVVEGAVAKGSGAMCGDLGAAASATGGAAEEPLGAKAVSARKFKPKSETTVVTHARVMPDACRQCVRATCPNESAKHRKTPGSRLIIRGMVGNRKQLIYIEREIG